MANSEEGKVIKAENSNSKLVAFNRIPYSLINKETGGRYDDTLHEFTRICEFYEIYRKGATFTPEGTNGDYVPADLKYKMSALLINKEARFLFAESPDILVEAKGNVGSVSQESKDALTTLNDLVKTILDKNMFEDSLLKAARDCFIGRRVACIVNFNPDDGVDIQFLPSTQFLYETRSGSINSIEKFVGFMILTDSINLSEKRVFEKKYTKEKGVVYLEETLYDGSGRLIEVVTEKTSILLKDIPVAIILNDGLSGEAKGESEIELLEDYEKWYSKLSNSDLDAERKSMNPTRYTVDMSYKSTKDLSTSPGSYWDLHSEQNEDVTNPQVGMLESNLSYSPALKISLDRIKTIGYEQVDTPNITLESMTGAITSGKALKAIYWPLIVRCKEKMKVWGPQLRKMTSIIIEGAMAYPESVASYTNDEILPVDYEIKIESNIPLPEDEMEEKQNDMAEVQTNVRSKKSYMIKWLQLTDTEAEEMLEQMAKERQILEDSSFDLSMEEDGFEEDTDTGEDTNLDDGEEEDTEIEDLLAELDAELEGM